jgi:putative NADH-flavin reductase
VTGIEEIRGRIVISKTYVLSFIFCVWATNAVAVEVLFFGATRNTGLEAVKLLAEQGHAVTAFVRASSDVAALTELDVRLVTGDALDFPSVASAFEGTPYDVVISTLSGGIRNTSVDGQGNINVFEAAEGAGVERVILVTTIGAGGTESVLPESAQRFLKPVIDAKTIAENDLRTRELTWTILRPGQLPEGAATGNGLLTEDQSTMGIITMGELAALIVQCVSDDATYNKIFHTVDSDMTGSVPSFD